jgi:transcriptional regulator with XRE-family HTH domain
MRTLREMLDGTGLPRYRIARAAGMSYSTLLLWERHGIPPKRIDVYARLAQVLGVEPRELMQQGGLIWHTETDAPTPHRMGYGRRGAIR